ncbi:cation-dependent mannose-6-phosphate receptor-like [Saccoglossus kowalevskii]|uniref:Uncharacterized protein LOC102805905 n=1 Tax=Saccoglossus kowalevskii TaxID=10224 RepID=A0ABM0MQ19_SACKO|nr:PREDICTED: uncharacterized protein LOC102805905 [Saccoglossus kowalevskii]
MRLGTSCDGVAACQHVHDSLYNLGTQDSVEYSVPSLGTVVLTYKEEVTTDKRSSIVTYKCNCDADSPILLALGETSPLKYEYKITSMHACVQACPPKEALSTGGILCIIFFVLVFVYFVGGILINKFVLKRENGRDLIPNVEFWSDLPYLIKDGFLFAISPCKKQNAYDQI